MIQDFLIADFRVRIPDGALIDSLGHFGRALRVFAVDYAPEKEPALTLEMGEFSEPDFAQWQQLDEFDFLEVNAICRFYTRGEEFLFSMERPDGRLWLKKHLDKPEVESNIATYPRTPEFGSLVRFGLWMMFGIAITPHHAIAIHSSTIQCGEQAALFLGESGTGKSTHTRLWREHIAGARLLNDDSPIIRLYQGEARIYGSPWSGKTPCYKQEYYPIGGMVRLSQAPHNKIRRLGVIQAIGALLPSCPPAFAFDSRLQDAICETLSQLIARVPVYHLECLPDKAAAELSFSTLLGHETNLK